MWPRLRQGTMSHWGCSWGGRFQPTPHTSLPRLLTNVTAVSPAALVSCSESRPWCAKLLTRGKVLVALGSQEKWQTSSSSSSLHELLPSGKGDGGTQPCEEGRPRWGGRQYGLWVFAPVGLQARAQLLLFNGVFQTRAHRVSFSLDRSETTPCWLGVETEQKDLSEDGDT